MGIDNIRHPIKDTVKADNSTYSSNKIESLIHSATELPETSIEDAGDVLMVNDEGEWDKGEIIIPQEVPTPTVENIGKVVSVVSDGDEGAEYGLSTPKSHFDNAVIGVMINNVIASPISLSGFNNSHPNEFSIGLINQPSNDVMIIFRYLGQLLTANKNVFGGFATISSKIYYYEFTVDVNATSVPSGTAVTRTEIG